MLHPKQTSRFDHTMRRLLALAIGACLCVSISGAYAQEVLIVLSSQSKPYVQAAQACESRLKEAGVQTKRVELASLSPEDIKSIADDVIAIGGRASAKLARDLPPSTRLFYSMAPRPSQIGLTGRASTSGISTEADFKEQLQLIQSGSASAKRIGALYRSSSPSSLATINAMRSVIPAGTELIAVDLDTTKSESEGIKQLLKQDIDIVWTVPDPSAYNQPMIKALLLKSLRKNIPVFGFSHSLVEAGATFGIGIDPAEQGEQVAEFSISKTLDVHLSARPQVAVNLIVAKRIKVKIADTFIRQAKAVFRSD